MGGGGEGEAKLGAEERAEGEEGRGGLRMYFFFLWLVDRIQRCGVLCFSCSKRLVSRMYPYRIGFPQLSYPWFCSVGLAKRCGGAKATLSDAQLDAQYDAHDGGGRKCGSVGGWKEHGALAVTPGVSS